MSIESDQDLVKLKAIGRIVALALREMKTHSWTLKTSDGSLVAQYEHTIVITQGRPLIITG